MKEQCIGTIAAMLVTCVVLVPFARATPYVLWETFSDADGNPAFLPAFVHMFEPHPERGTEHLRWSFSGDTSGNQWLYVDSSTIDYITFVLEPGQYVSHASVSHPEGQGDITFIGQNGQQNIVYPGLVPTQWFTTEMDMSTIGPIQAIILTDGYYDDIRITVVPEPSTWLLFITGTAAFLVCRKHRLKAALA